MDSNEKSNGTTRAGVGFWGLLQIVFITLKLLDKISWSWWLVLAPMWVPTAILIVAAVAVAIFYGIAGKISDRRRKKKGEAYRNH